MSWFASRAVRPLAGAIGATPILIPFFDRQDRTVKCEPFLRNMRMDNQPQRTGSPTHSEINLDDVKAADKAVVDCIRCLAMDAVQKANSGHPGTPMGMAPVAYNLWARHMNFDPEDAIWWNRDRFVLSAGHASMLIYSILHLAGVKAVSTDYEIGGEPAVSLDDLKNFRQLDSKCPGHPEYRWTSGIETTTGPLGQGFASSVGMAIAGKWMAATYNKPDFELFNWNVFSLGGDGCMQEGVQAEAASLAGHLKLDNLCWIYDNNKISIEGNTDWSYSEDVTTRFIGYGWNVLRVGDANDQDALDRAFKTFKMEKHRPTLIIVDSHIGFGAPTKQGTGEVHGAPLGEKEISATKKVYGWPDEKFLVPEDCKHHFQSQLQSHGGQKRREWNEMFRKYTQLYPTEASAIKHQLARTLPDGWERFCTEFPPSPKGLATRQSSGQVLNMVAQGLPWLIGGSADLSPSTLTDMKFKGAGHFLPPGAGYADCDYSGRNFHFGIREHAMGSIMCGMAVSKVRPYGSTFFVFSDYMKPPIRMSAIMEIPCIFIFTHDSIGVGEDGPTHQPIEHLAAVRSIPGLLTFRPGDANEVLEAWKYIIPLRHTPAALVLSRQAVPTLDRTKYAPASGVARGAYVLADASKGREPQVILMATGTEVSLMLEAHEKLAAQGIGVRSVSMPCLELFEQQGTEYKDSILPKNVRARVSIEAGSTIQWARYVGIDGASVGVDTFGKSAPLKIVQEDFGLTVDKVLATAHKVLRANGSSAATGGESNALSQLKAMTTIVADTGELDKIKAILPEDATTNPTLIFQALNTDGGKVMFDKAINAAMKKMGRNADEEALASEVCDRLAVMIGCEILKIVPGLVSTEVDANLSFSTEASLAKARHLVELYEDAGINPRERVLIKMASTWESIDACRQLEREGIHCNMTLLFARSQAIACAEANATLISPFVGRILDWYKKSEGRDFTAEEDPGVLSVRAIYAYYKKYGHKTIVMGASFRTADECLALAGCDKLTISPKVIGEIQARSGPVPRKLHPTLSAKDAPPRLSPQNLTEKEFRLLLNEDQMATEKLSEGIRGFGKDLAKLKDLVRQRLGLALGAHEAGLKSMS